MFPVVSLDFTGGALTPTQDLPVGAGCLGRPAWGPAEWLRDLELRLGLPTPPPRNTLRLTRWAARMRSSPGACDFYAASFERDPLGTAAAALGLRDALVDAGWQGEPIPEAGPRIAGLVALETCPGPPLPLGVSDRVARVAKALEGRRQRLYEGVSTGEPLACWSGAWRRVFAALARSGTHLHELEELPPGAATETDLGRVQNALRGEASKRPLEFDGSLQLLEAETIAEAAEATAALLGVEDPASVVVIREDHANELDHALWARGLPTQGAYASSPWRPLLQLLPLALELAFEPRDPSRVLELLTLWAGPFQGSVGRVMARAVCRSPGIGGKAWHEAKERLHKGADGRLEALGDWLETPGADPSRGATEAELRETVGRVRRWLVGRVPSTPDDPSLFAAIEQCDEVLAALEELNRERFDQVTMRRLADLVVRGSGDCLLPEQVGRAAYVTRAEALWVQRPVLVWWSFIQQDAKLEAPFRKREVEALARAGLTPVDPELGIARRARGSRRAVLAASQKLILVVPRHVAGGRVATHPLWDELVARLGLDAKARARLTSSATELLRTAAVPSQELESLPLPGRLAEWSLEPDCLVPVERHSASSLESLLGCPLKWTLDGPAALKTEEHELPAQAQLNGSLGHRLVEELHLAGAFELQAKAFRDRAETEVELLIRTEGALLLRAGKAHELYQVRHQLVDGACALAAVLSQNALSILGVERSFEVPWQSALLIGRWDLVVQDANGRRLVIDLKWGQSSHRKKLETGQALQLATYAYALSPSDPNVRAAYFSLRAQRLLGHSDVGLEPMQRVRGTSLRETWKRVERTLPIVQDRVSKGKLLATGLHDSPPHLELLGVSETERAAHYEVPAEATCEYCGFDALCGRRWEGTP